MRRSRPPKSAACWHCALALPSSALACRRRNRVASPLLLGDSGPKMEERWRGKPHTLSSPGPCPSRPRLSVGVRARGDAGESLEFKQPGQSAGRCPCHMDCFCPACWRTLTWPCPFAFAPGPETSPQIPQAGRHPNRAAAHLTEQRIAGRSKPSLQTVHSAAAAPCSCCALLLYSVFCTDYCTVTLRRAVSVQLERVCSPWT